MRLLLAVTLLLGVSMTAHAATRIWPGAAPCNTTMQACLSGATPNDVIFIATNAPIDEALTVDRPLSIRAAAGFSPRMAAGRSLNATSPAGVAFDFSVEKLTFNGGFLTVLHSQPVDATISLDRVVVENPQLNSGIAVQSIADARFDVTIRSSRVTLGLSSANGIVVGRSGSGYTQPVTAQLYFNEVTGTVDDEPQAIEVRVNPGSDVRVLGNRITGSGFGRGIFLYSPYGGTQSNANVLSNIVSGQRETADSQGGIAVVGNFAANVLNNTVVDNTRGISVLGVDEGTTSGVVANNLVAFNTSGLFIDPTTSVTNQSNLVHGNGTNAYVAGPGTIAAAPQLTSLTQPFLQPGSPAIDAGSPTRIELVYSSVGLPRVDASGLRRFKGAQVDIGAMEFGDVTFLNRGDVLEDGTAVTPPADAAMTPSALAQFTLNVNPRGSIATVSNSDPMGFSFTGSRWVIFNENGAFMTPGIAFNVFRPADGAEAFSHLATSGTSTSFVSNPTTNGRPERIFLATHHYNGAGSPGELLVHPVGGAFNFDIPPVWRIRTLNGAAIPVNTSFNVYSQDESPNAYVHVASGSNTVSNFTLLDHPLLNGQPCALVTASRVSGTGAYPVGVLYSIDDGRHAIVHQAAASPAVNTRYHVLVDERQILRDCGDALFGNGFED